jgi:hypothetical protein
LAKAIGYIPAGYHYAERIFSSVGFDWNSVIAKIIIAEIVFIILKLAYGAYVTMELAKKNPVIIVPEYFNQFSWQALASPVWLILSTLFGEEIEEKRQDALKELGIPLFIDDIFGKYFLIIAALIPVVIILYELLTHTKKRNLSKRRR